MKSNNRISNVRESLAELREDISETFDRWLSRIGRDRDKDAFPVSAEAFWNRPFDWTSGQPSVDIEEDDERLIVRAEVPGLAKNDLQVELDDRYLTISGSKEARREQQQGRMHISECRYGTFSRLVPLPCEVDRAKAKAKCRNGMLTLTLPKTEAAKARRIEVSYEE